MLRRRGGEIPLPVPPGKGHGVGGDLVYDLACHRHAGVGVLCQGRQTLEVEEKFHIALGGQAGLDLRLPGMKGQFRRIGEQIRMGRLQSRHQAVQVLLAALGRLCGQSGDGKGQGCRQGHSSGPPEKYRSLHHGVPSYCMSIIVQ